MEGISEFGELWRKEMCVLSELSSTERKSTRKEDENIQMTEQTL